MTLLNRSGLAAIAAATVLLATPVLAQDAAPVTADPAPIVADTPLPAEPAPEVVSDPLAPAATTTSTTTTHTTRTASPARVTTAPTARTVRAPAPVARPTTAAPVEEAAPPVDPAMVAPLPEPVAAAPVAAAESTTIEDILPIAGAAGLGLLALAGAGLAMRRRRRDEDVEVEHTFREPVMSRAEPARAATAPIVATAPLVAKPAFNWGNAPREMAPSMSRIDAARRGPTADNPSLSLKKRMQRAAFFDRRERQVAAGEATPMSPMAGLPDALAKSPVPDARPARRPDHGVHMSFGRTFHPA